MTSLELKLPPPVIFLFFVVGAWLVSAPNEARAALWSPRWGIAVVLVVLGFLLARMAMVGFRRAGTTVDPRRPERSSRLVTDGVFSRTRNPMYLALLLWLVGWSVYWGATFGWLLPPLFVAVIQRLQIVPEERMLLQMFGEEYRAYMSSVRRWL
ncbi:MAG: isoprenylcysteine carboxylmethyltransferase family protein [Gemmatimonadota bacterium]